MFLDKREEVDREGDARLGRISDAVKVLLECIGEDVEREGLLKTPERYAKALLYLTKGYTEDLERTHTF
jgi:GTP cyclohydrolase I